MTLCNGRIKDGPTPVKAPHTRRRLTTLFLRPTPVRAVIRSRSPSLLRGRPIFLSFHLFPSRQCTSFSHGSCLSLSVLHLYLRLLDSPPRATVRPFIRSLSSSANTHPLSHSPPSPSRHTFPPLLPPPLTLSCYLILLPSRRAIPRSRVHPGPLSVFFSFFDQFFDPI